MEVNSYYNALNFICFFSEIEGKAFRNAQFMLDKNMKIVLRNVIIQNNGL